MNIQAIVQNISHFTEFVPLRDLSGAPPLVLGIVKIIPDVHNYNIHDTGDVYQLEDNRTRWSLIVALTSQFTTAFSFAGLIILLILQYPATQVCGSFIIVWKLINQSVKYSVKSCKRVLFQH